MGTMKWSLSILLFLFIVLQGQLWFSQGGVVDLWRIHHKLGQLNQQIFQVRSKNKMLAADIKDLKFGQESIEERAREDLGMKKNGETFYWVVPQK